MENNKTHYFIETFYVDFKEVVYLVTTKVYVRAVPHLPRKTTAAYLKEWRRKISEEGEWDTGESRCAELEPWDRGISEECMGNINDSDHFSLYRSQIKVVYRIIKLYGCPYEYTEDDVELLEIREACSKKVIDYENKTENWKKEFWRIRQAGFKIYLPPELKAHSLKLCIEEKRYLKKDRERFAKAKDSYLRSMSKRRQKCQQKAAERKKLMTCPSCGTRRYPDWNDHCLRCKAPLTPLK